MWISQDKVVVCVTVALVIFVVLLLKGSHEKHKAEKAQAELLTVQRSLSTREMHFQALETDLRRQLSDLKKNAEANALKQYQERLSELAAKEARVCDEISHGVCATIYSGARNSLGFFSSSSIFRDFAGYDFLNNSRLFSALQGKSRIVGSPFVRATMRGNFGEYTVTLDSCTCPDFRARHIPCKHMYRLAIDLGLLSTLDRPEAESFLRGMEQVRLGAQQALEMRAAANARLKEAAKREEQLQTYIEQMKKKGADSFPWIAAQYADALTLIDKSSFDDVASRSRVSKNATTENRKLKKEKNVWVRQAKALQYRLALYESLVPWLADTMNYTPQELLEANEQTISNPDEEYTVLRTWLSPAEYKDLSEAARYQLSLDRYRRRKRSPWEVGRDFERFVGYQYETSGQHVSFYGALSGLADLGRDLLVKDGSTVLVVQCKRWMEKRTVHEKHVFQLFGSTISYEMEHPGSSPKGLLITTCPLSDVASAYAARLGVEVKSSYPVDRLDTYPLIKCNISKTGEKIYHLPFDQQYDRVSINTAAGEFYALTVQEAIDRGFRRAFRWRSSAAGA